MGKIKYITGDLLKSDADALVNTVNCVGVMGRGIALQFKQQFPDNFNAYKKACNRAEVQPGKMFIVKRNNLLSPRYIINFPTKRHWKGKSRLEDINTGLLTLREEIQQRGIRSIAIPPLGSGLGGLNWQDVRALIDSILGNLPDVQIIVYEPSGAPEVVRCQEVPVMTSGRAVLVALMEQYLAGLMDPFVSLLEVHKLIYFMQEAGEPLSLKFQKGYYGPYAENLRHVLRSVEGHLISGYSDGGDQPDKQLKLVPGAVSDAKKYLADKPDVRDRFDRVVELVDGFETPFGLELLATVHWVVRHDRIGPGQDLVKKVHSWGTHKLQFTPHQIKIAFETLSQKGWFYDRKR